jgi:3-oxoacyl-[acyl-carrier-protein] synthase-3
LQSFYDGIGGSTLSIAESYLHSKSYQSKSSVHSIGYYLPKKKLTNAELAKLYSGWTEERIFSKTGISERHIAGEDEFVLDLAEKAVLNLFAEYDVQPEEIDFIILCTQSPDHFLPTTACLLQERLNIPTSCGALDINLGCSGYIYSLALAKSLINTDIAETVLLIMSETYTKHIHPFDKSTRTIFGDGAAAVLLRENSIDHIGRFILGTDGKGAKNLIIPAGGMRVPRTAETGIVKKDKFGNERSQEHLYMNGPEMFNFTANLVPKLVRDLLAKNDLTMDEIDLFVFHQASYYLLENLREKIGIPKEKFFINLEKIGNTVSASIPIALKCAEDEGRIALGDRVMIVGFGVGYSWSGTVIEY